MKGFESLDLIVRPWHPKRDTQENFHGHRTKISARNLGSSHTQKLPFIFLWGGWATKSRCPPDIKERATVRVKKTMIWYTSLP